MPLGPAGELGGAPLIGKTLGHYEISAKPGEESMGVVHKARDLYAQIDQGGSDLMLVENFR